MMEYARINESELDIFKNHARILISGYSGGGKSWLASKIIKKYSYKFDHIIVLGSNLENVNNLVKRDDSFDPYVEKPEGRILCIFDDFLFSKPLLQLAAKLAIDGRHLQISTLFLSQNLIFNNNFYRIITLNLTGHFLFKTRDQGQISYFGRTFLSKDKIESFLNLYKKVVVKKNIVISF